MIGDTDLKSPKEFGFFGAAKLLIIVKPCIFK
jgi:hypothetical protein